MSPAARAAAMTSPGSSRSPAGVRVAAGRTASTPPGRSTRSHAAYSTPPAPGLLCPVMARAACPASGQPGSSSSPGPPAGRGPAGAAPDQVPVQAGAGHADLGRAGEQAQDPAPGRRCRRQQGRRPGGGDHDQLTGPGKCGDGMRGLQPAARRRGGGPDAERHADPPAADGWAGRPAGPGQAGRGGWCGRLARVR